MGSLFSKNTHAKPKGIISEDMIHRIDMMDDADDAVQQPYKSRRRNNLNDDQLFDDNVYGDEEDSDSGSGIIVVITIVAIIAIGVIAAVLLI